jgi:hypothetical protein
MVLAKKPDTPPEHGHSREQLWLLDCIAPSSSGLKPLELPGLPASMSSPSCSRVLFPELREVNSRGPDLRQRTKTVSLAQLLPQLDSDVAKLFASPGRARCLTLDLPAMPAALRSEWMNEAIAALANSDCEQNQALLALKPTHHHFSAKSQDGQEARKRLSEIIRDQLIAEFLRCKPMEDRISESDEMQAEISVTQIDSAIRADSDVARNKLISQGRSLQDTEHLVPSGSRLIQSPPNATCSTGTWTKKKTTPRPATSPGARGAPITSFKIRGSQHASVPQQYSVLACGKPGKASSSGLSFSEAKPRRALNIPGPMQRAFLNSGRGMPNAAECVPSQSFEGSGESQIRNEFKMRPALPAPVPAQTTGSNNIQQQYNSNIQRQYDGSTVYNKTQDVDLQSVSNATSFVTIEEEGAGATEAGHRATRRLAALRAMIDDCKVLDIERSTRKSIRDTSGAVIDDPHKLDLRGLFFKFESMVDELAAARRPSTKLHLAPAVERPQTRKSNTGSDISSRLPVGNPVVDVATTHPFPSATSATKRAPPRGRHGAAITPAEKRPRDRSAPGPRSTQPRKPSVSLDNLDSFITSRKKPGGTGCHGR